MDIPQHWRPKQASPIIHFLRQYDIDEFSNTLSDPELLEFFPENPKQDWYIFAMREADVLRLLCEDPHVFLDYNGIWFKSKSRTK
jgi:hypothetical protein